MLLPPGEHNGLNTAAAVYDPDPYSGTLDADPESDRRQNV